MTTAHWTFPSPPWVPPLSSLSSTHLYTSWHPHHTSETSKLWNDNSIIWQIYENQWHGLFAYILRMTCLLTVVLQLVSIVLNTILNANYFTRRTLITPSNSRLSHLRFWFFAWTDRSVTNWFWFDLINSRMTYHCFDSWLAVRKSIWPITKLNDEVLSWLSVCSEMQMICICGPADATVTTPYLASLKSKLVLSFRCWLMQVVLEKRPLNGCLSVMYHWTLSIMYVILN